MTARRPGSATRDCLVGIVLLAAVAAALWFSGAIQMAYDTVTDLWQASRESASNVSDLIEEEKSPRVSANVHGGLDDFRVVVTLKKAPGELKQVRATVTAHSPDGSKFVKNVEWESWKPDDDQTVPIPAMTVKSVVVEGTATHDGKEIKISPKANKFIWEPPYTMPVVDYARFDFRLVGTGPAKQFRLRSLQPFDMTDLDLTLKSISKSGETTEGKVAREVWRTDEEIVSELPDPNYRRLSIEGTATARGKTVRVYLAWTRQDDK